MWDLDSGHELRTLEGHSGAVSGVAMTPDGKRAVSADKTLKVWDLESGAVIATFHCDGAAGCCVFVDQHRIVAGDAGGRVYMLALIESAAKERGHHSKWQFVSTARSCCYIMPGRRCIDRVLCSNAYAICRTLHSSRCRPTIWRPTGRPSGV